MARILSQSFRYNNAFLKTKKFDLSSTKHVDADVDWIIGSANGTMKLVDFDGTVYEPGTAEYDTVYGGSKALWSGQHNLEYFGEKEFMMFDNAFDCTGADAWNSDGAGFVGNSRMLIVEVDEEENTATLVWEYKMGYNTSIYGDADRLPTGNILGSGWPSKGGKGNEGDLDTFDAEIVEVTREDAAVAWRAEIWGNGRRKVEASSPYGWIMYSVERVYKGPIISGTPSCSTDDDSSSDVLTTTVYNSFKLSSTYGGHYTVTSFVGDEVTSGAFDFSAHWRETNLEISLDSGACVDGCTLAITNAVYDNRTATFSC